MSFSKENRSHTINGIFFVSIFALASVHLAEYPWLAKAGISSLVLAIIFGIIYGNTLRHGLPKEWTPGIQFSAKRLLRLAIILYGFRITFQQIISVGFEGLIIDLLVVILTLVLGAWVGIRVFKLDRHLAILISAGAAICGAAAVLAAEDVLKSEPYKTAMAVGTVVLFGTLGMFIYPVLQHAGIFGFTPNQFGLFAGASIHEVAQVLVAGTNISVETGDVAVIVKMTRVLMLAPVLFFLSIYEGRVSNKKGHKKSNIMIPWFAVIFVLMIGVNSLNILPAYVIAVLNKIDIFLLTMAMAAIGMETNLKKLREVGIKPLYFALLIFLWLTVGVYLLVKFFA